MPVRRLPGVNGIGVPVPGDIGVPGLRRLGEGADQRHLTDGVTSVSVLRIGQLTVSFRDQTAETRDARIAGRVPDAYPQVCAGELVEQPPTVEVGDGRRIDPATVARITRETSTGDGIALHHLAQTVADRLKRMIAGGEAVAVGLETTAAWQMLGWCS